MKASNHSAGATVAALVWVAVTTSACTSEPPPTPPTVRDSAGVRIVEHGPSPDGLATWSLAELPEAIIGSLAEEDLAHQFTQIRGAVRLSDGRIVVGDWDSREARYFDREGHHLLTVGGRGEGPGEIRNLYNIDRVRGDTLVIDGWPIGSRYWFDERGVFVRHQALGPWFPGMLGRTLPDGSMILDTYEFGSYGNTLETWAANGPDEDIRLAGVVELVSRDGSRVDTLAPILGEWFHKTGRLGVNFAMHALPFTPVGLVAWSTDHVFIGHTERPEVRVYSLSGSLVRLIRWSAETVAVTRDDRRPFEDEVMSVVRRPAIEPSYRRWLSEISYPDVKPSFAAMISDEEGFLWVRASTPADADAATWTVFGPDGLATATLSMPARFEVFDVDATHVLVAWKDDLDVEYVSSYEVVR